MGCNVFLSVLRNAGLGLLNSFDAMRVIYGTGAGLFILVMNSSPILSVTDAYAMLHLFIIALGLYMLSFSAFELLHTKLIKALNCARLLKAQAIGVMAGSVLILPLAVLSGFSGFLSHAVQLVTTGSLSLFFMFYDFTFSSMFSQIAETGTSGKPPRGVDLVSTSGFSRMLLAANIYPILPIVALLASSQFVIALIIVLFQVVSTFVGLGLHGLSIRWIQGTFSPQGQPTVSQC